MTQANSKIDPLQALRAFAAISVMFYHGTQMIHEKLGYLFLDNAFGAGFSGVDVFFVLSGFIILYSSANKNLTISEFLKKRFMKIYPIYWIVTLLLILAYLASPVPEQAYKVDKEVVLGSFLLIPQKQYVLGVAWTLSYEILFYLVFAITYLNNSKFLLYAFAIWISIILISSFTGLKIEVFSLDALLHPIIIDFALGCLVAYAYMRFPKFSNWKIILITGIVLFIAASILYCQIMFRVPNAFAAPISRVYLFGIPAALLIFGILYIKTTVPRLLVYLGDASYSVYLLHGTVLSILIKIASKLNGIVTFGNLLGSVVLFAVTVAVCGIFYTLVEKPLLAYFKRRIDSN